MARDIVKPFLVTGVVAVTCSFLVSMAAVGLRERQEDNRRLDIIKQALIAADLYDPDQTVEEAFEQFDIRLVELDTGAFVPPDEIDPMTYNFREALKDPDLSEALPASDDPAGLRRREKYALVALIEKDGALDRILIPVRGAGLFSTMYAFVSLDTDFSTILGVVFYEQAETAGLGGEVSNPRWLAGWQGKQAYDENGNVAFGIARGADAGSPHAVDAISGATLTTNGVTNLMGFWFGESGFRPLLDRLREEGVTDG